MRPRPIPIATMLIAASLAITGTATAKDALRLVPYPRHVERLPGSVRLGPSWSVYAAYDQPDSVGVDGLIRDVNAALSWTWSIGSNGGRQTVIVRTRPPFGRGVSLEESQGYDLKIDPDSIVVAAPTRVGRY